MANICEICGKKTVIGRSQRHKRGVAGKRWKKRAQVTPRTFKPNLQRATLIIGGQERKVTLCVKCLKRFKKEGKTKSQQIRIRDSLA